MRRQHQVFALVVLLVACGDSIAGPKPPSETSTILKATVTLSKLVVQRGDTMRFGYTVENLTAGPLTLNTDTGCQIQPELDQVGGARMDPPALFGALICPSDPTVRTLAVGEKFAFSVLLRAYDPSKPTAAQFPGYLLTTGTFDASLLVRATEVGGQLRSDWVRFQVK